MKIFDFAKSLFTLQPDNLDEQVAETPVNEPYVATDTVVMDSSITMFLVIERDIICDVKCVYEAIKTLLAVYYILNVAYPKLLWGPFTYCYALCLKNKL